MYEITVRRQFAAAHAIYLPDGSLEPLHGHDWQVQVTVQSDGLDTIETVMDFHTLEQQVDTIIAPWHNAHLNNCAPFADGQGGLAINPSAERVAQTIGETLTPQLPAGVRLGDVLIEEAAGCWARHRPTST
jgi:6-pyruvoyltetrahydropterin/6-carboxytetrahydropterin synthase